jgi:ABC-type branched-subunit amino acid transport system ATPase component
MAPGKTTLINLLTGVFSPNSGQILLGGEDITALPSHGRVGRGLSRTFQINQLFGDFTPLDSMMLAISERQGHGRDVWRALSSHREVVDEAAALLERFRLADAMATATTLLPYGKQRLLEIALAIATQPKVLLLDEPAAGVPEDERHEVLGIVRELSADVTVVLIEHDMDLVFSFADRISVLAAGALFAEGTVAEISKDPQVKAIYLGEDA